MYCTNYKVLINRYLYALLLAFTFGSLYAQTINESDVIKSDVFYDENESIDGWYRGSMHTHSFWNDGRDFPENIAKWYKENGYNFVVFTEHDIIQKGEQWVILPEDHPAIERYLAHLGDDWVEMIPDKDQEGYVKVRVIPLNEYRGLFEKPGEFLLMNGIEITDQHGVHFLAYHVDEVIPTVGGSSNERARMINDIVRLVENYRKRSGRNTYPILAHPNWNWNITAEMIKHAESLRFFEVFNGVPEANNEGDEFRPGTDRVWDIILAYRLGQMNGKLIYGVATDDAHDYDGGRDGRNVGPGKGWIMGRSDTLTSESILDAIDRGEFYSSTGVVLKDIRFDGDAISVEIQPRENEKYTVKYIGTRRDFDSASKPALDHDGSEIKNSTRIYSEQIGETLKKTENIRSRYDFQGDELYVRVLIISTADQIDLFTGEVIGIQKAWVQPIVPNRN